MDAVTLGLAQSDAKRRYIPPLGKTTPGAAAPMSRVNIIDQGAIADAKTLSDATMTVGTATLTSASATFTLADVGKTIVVSFAGKIGPATTTSAALTTASPIATIPVAALPAALPAGTVILTSGSNVQAFETTGAASGATTIPVVSNASSTPYFAFPSGTAVSTPVLPMKTTITGVNSNTSITLAATASQTVSAKEAVYGTNNFTVIQAAINAAIAFRVPLYIPAAPASVDGFLYDGALIVNDQLAIDGDGAFERHTPNTSGATGTSLYTDNMPTEAPYISGSVLIQAAQNTNAVTFTRAFSVNPLKSFGIRFAGKFVATGHAFAWTPPVVNGPSLDNGLMDSVVDAVKVYGHDGNHYAFEVMNSLYTTWINCHSFGGGGIHMAQQSVTCACGNAVFIHQYAVVVVGGSAHAIYLSNTGTLQQLNYITFLRSQSWIYSVSNLVAAGYVAPTSSQSMIKSFSTGTAATGQGIVHNISWYSPDAETNVGATADFSNASGYGVIVHGGQSINWGAAEPTAASPLLNNTGSTLLYFCTYDFTPVPGVNAELIAQTGQTGNITFTQVHEIIPAAAAAVGATLSASLSTAGGITSLPINALAAPLPFRSTITVVSGTNRQTWVLNAAAAAGATTLSVYGQTPNFAYPSGSNIYMSTRKTIKVVVLSGQWLQFTATAATFAKETNSPGLVGSY